MDSKNSKKTSKDKNEVSSSSYDPVLDQAELLSEISSLEAQIENYKHILKQNGIETTGELSDEESICISEIHKLRKLSDTRGLQNDEVKNLDILVKNLRIIRGQSVETSGKKNKLGKKDTKELLSIISGKK